MKRHFLQILIILFFFGCNHSTKTENLKNYSYTDSLETKYKIGFYPTNNQKYYYVDKIVNGNKIQLKHDYLDIDSLFILGKFKQYSTLEKFAESFGKPDSTKRIDELEYNYSILYFNNAVFLMHDYDSLLYCDKLDFQDTSMFITYKNFKFNSETNLNEFAENFPLSTLNMERNRTFIGDTKYDWIRLSAKNDYQREDEFIFLFHDNKLRYFTYYLPD